MIELDIYREARADSLRPGMVVGDVTLETVAWVSTDQLKVTGTNVPTGRKVEFRLRDSERVKVAPTYEQIHGVWSGLLAAIKVAASDFLEGQELDDTPGQAPPWEMHGGDGAVSVDFRHQRFVVAPQLPAPEAELDDDDGDG